MTSIKTVTIFAPKLVWTLGATIVVLLCVSTFSGVLYISGVRPNGSVLFYVDNEKNLPTFFSAGQLLMAAALLLAIAVIEGREKKLFAVQWKVLAIGFFLLSVDEICSVHEMMIGPVRSLLGTEQLGLFFFAWIIPAVIFLVGLSFYFWKFIVRLPGTTRQQFLLAAALYVGGSIGVEMLGGRHCEQHGYDNITYLVYTTVEEGLEMTGILVFLRALLFHIAGYDGINLHVKTGQ